jgi:hypothetical protein
MLLAWLGLIIGWLIIAAYAVVWTRANQGRLMRRGHPHSKRPPRWSYLLLSIGTGVAVFSAERLQRQSLGWWALLIFIGGALIAQMAPIALHNRSVRRVSNGPHP